MGALFGKHPDSYLDIESLNSKWKASGSLTGHRILMGILQKVPNWFPDTETAK
jgi:hypothetical protein